MSANFRRRVVGGLLKSPVYGKVIYFFFFKKMGNRLPVLEILSIETQQAFFLLHSQARGLSPLR